VLDVGCGIGTWLRVFEEHGVADYLGIDGDYVDKSLLKIPLTKFHPCDLQSMWSINRKFDLVISLEVAEHLNIDCAHQFIESLTNHSNLILFSAAIPGQQGQNHVNEQWLSYWVEIFKKHNYICLDLLRSRIWDNNAVEVWYKQNMVLFCAKDHPALETLKQQSSCFVDIVHPDLFSSQVQHANRNALYEEGRLGIRIALRSLLKSLRNKFL
jgi:hypothetical protein